MAQADRTSAAAQDSGDLRREVARVRRRARAVLLAGALIAAFAADLWYEILSFWSFRYFRVPIRFPFFFLVVFVVFAAAALHRTRTLRFSALLDGRFALKARLASAFRFERLSAVSADVREAQARETLRAVDFGRLRSSFRLRPWGELAFLAAGAGCTVWLMYRHPESFNPNSVTFRQGRVVFMAVKSLGAGGGQQDAGTRGGGNDSRQGSSAHPQVVLVAEQGAPGKDPPGGAQTSGTTGLQPPSGGKGGPGAAPEPESGPREKPPGHPESSANRDASSPPDKRGEGKGARVGPDTGGSLGRPVTLEETEGITPPTARPESGLATGAENLRGPGAGLSLPPLPFVRLLGGGRPEEALFDPETLNIVLEAYPPKYREHLESYLKALQTLREDRNGS